MTAPDLFGGMSALESPADEEPLAPDWASRTVMVPDQVPLFDLSQLTVKVPGQEQREAMDAAGLTPQSRKLTYDAASIRQIVTYWQQDHYLEILKQLERAARVLGTDSHTDTLEQLLAFFWTHHTYPAA